MTIIARPARFSLGFLEARPWGMARHSALKLTKKYVDLIKAAAGNTRITMHMESAEPIVDIT